MYRDLWLKCHKAVCSINFLGSNDSLISGITGFRYKNRIITDDILYDRKDVKDVEIRFYHEDGFSVFKSIRMPYSELLEKIPVREEFENMGFAVIPANFPELNGSTSLELSRACSAGIGLEAVSIGFQLEHKNLSLKSAIISSYYKNGKGHCFIQYDGTVKPGSTGGPLINVKSGEVIGIIAIKEMKSTRNYLELMKIIKSNLEVLKEAEGKWKLDDIDPIQVLIASQNQIRHMAGEFFRNSAIRVGFALDAGYISEYLESNHEDVEQSNFLH